MTKLEENATANMCNGPVINISKKMVICDLAEIFFSSIFNRFMFDIVTFSNPLTILAHSQNTDMM